MAGYWPSSFFACVCEHEHTKKEQDQYPAILIEQAWSIKDLLYGIRHQRSELCTLVYKEASYTQKTNSALSFILTG